MTPAERRIKVYKVSSSPVSSQSIHHVVFRRILPRQDGSWQPAEINLDDVIGNDDGWFSRDTTGFTQSADDITFEFRGSEPWLEAELPTRDGGSRGRQGINLGLHITNNDGNLEWYGQ
ncbi:hypothetical protein AFLA_004760 [Aspergillus flavus NRRL3357]|nr:hypothetical protein AFLA_004760 [Aspergillus flavus NRRL3357]